MAWVSTYDQVTKEEMEIEIDSGLRIAGLSFTEFAATFVLSEKPRNSDASVAVYFSDSSRIRGSVLRHVFRPLLVDVFSFNVVGSIFDALGTSADSAYKTQCFGEWFVLLPVAEICDRGLLASSSSVTRFLEEIAERDLESEPDQDRTLSTLFSFCEQSEETLRAFMLAVVCREAVQNAATKAEERTYGTISRSKIILPWERMLRKLRVCLLVSLRLHGVRLGEFPLTIRNVEDGNMFSVYEWIARDELNMTLFQEEIVTLETACRISSYRFDPSLPEGDGPSRYIILQNACLSASVSDDERAEYLLDFHDDDRFGALLLFFAKHNCPESLVSHRMLLLFSMWSQSPQDLDILDRAVDALDAAHAASPRTAVAGLTLEVWQSHLRPIYRARLFGFADVQELSAAVVEPLLRDKQWSYRLSIIAFRILSVLVDNVVSLGEENGEANGESTNSDSWPPVRPDKKLDSLREKALKVNHSAVERHFALVCALHISTNVGFLRKCDPSIDDSFLAASLFSPPGDSEFSTADQIEFLKAGVIKLAKSYSGPPLENFEILRPINVVSGAWKIDQRIAATHLVVALYELGKDRLVDEMLTNITSQIDVDTFLERILEVVCCRVHESVVKLRSSGNDVLALLDARSCEWAEQIAEASTPLVGKHRVDDVPPGGSHLLCLRILSICNNMNVDASVRTRVMRLNSLTSTLMKVRKPEERRLNI
jgi:hypothetical protein